VKHLASLGGGENLKKKVRAEKGPKTARGREKGYLGGGRKENSTTSNWIEQ